MDRNLVFPRSLRYLMAVAEYQSFTRAAEALYVSQPTLSQQIKQLEDLLDVQLLDRTGRNVRLTPAGEIYLYHARRALGELNAAERAIGELHDLSRGSLRVGMTPITEYLAIPLLEQFNARFPGINVNTLEMPQDEIRSALADDQIDIGFSFSNASAADAVSDDIDSHILFVETLKLAVGKGHPLAEETAPMTMHVLEQVPLVMLNKGYALRRSIDQYCLQQDIKLSIVMEASSLSMIIEMVRLGRLATILPDTISCAQPGFRCIALLPEFPHHTISVVCRRGAYKSPACQAFAEVASNWSASKCPVTPSHRLRPCPMVDVCAKVKEGFGDGGNAPDGESGES
ncbi:MAG TPA: transcriptional regulator CynR [Thiobacillaceae bacterium]|nr:transcriptional regulator CynR [Thiobacillaceae bacterium]